MERITVLGGQYNHPNLNNKISDVEYAKMKVHIWLFMLNDGNKPKKWLKKNGRGTKVNFDRIHSQEEYEEGLKQLDAYIQEVNELYGLDYKLNKN